MRIPKAAVVLCFLVLVGYCLLSGFNYYLSEDQLRNAALSASFLPLGLLTHFFAHVGLLHLVGNLVPLVIFAAICESRLKAREVLALFFFSGVLAASIFSLLQPGLLLVGASTGISGLIGAAIVMRPKLALFGVVASLVVVSVAFPIITSSVATQNNQLALEAQTLSEKVEHLIANNEFEAALALNSSFAAVSQRHALLSEGIARDAATPSNYLVHIFGGLFGVLFVFIVAKNQMRKGVLEAESLVFKLFSFAWRKSKRIKQRKNTFS